MKKFRNRAQPTGHAEFTRFRNLFIAAFQSASNQISGGFQESGTSRSDFTNVVRRFWETYQGQAQEYDTEFLTMHNEDVDITMIFVGLFCAVCATFIVFIQPQLSPDPNDITHALLTALIITMNGTIPPGLPSPSPPTPPSSTLLWSQSLLYASLAIGLYAALGAVMGKQWLSHYDRVGIRGTVEDRGKERQRKFEALMKWHFHSVLESLPFLLELSLFLFGVGLSAYLWDQQKPIGILYFVINAIGAILYVTVTMAAAWYPDCPFQTPFSLRLRRSFDSLRQSVLFLSSLWGTVFLPVINQSSSRVRQQFGALRQQYMPIVRRWMSNISPIVDAYAVQHVRAAWETLSRFISVTSRTVSSSFVRLARGNSGSPPGSSSRRHGHSDVENLQTVQVMETIAAVQETGPDVSQSLPPRTVWAELKDLFKFARLRGGTQAQPTEPQAASPLLKAWAKIKTFRRKKIPSVIIFLPAPPTNPSDATSVVWILDTCTDPSVEAVTLEYILSIDWPYNFDFRPLLDRFFLGFIECFEINGNGNIVGSLTPAARDPERNAAYGKTFLFLYWYARTIAPDSVTKWQRPMVRGQHREMWYDIDRIPHDELTYLYLLVKEIIDSHGEPERDIPNTHAVIPGSSVLNNMSQTTAVALSRYWFYSLQHTPTKDLKMCYMHILAMSTYVPMTPAVLTHYSTVFAQAVGYVYHRMRLEEGEFDTDAMLSRMRNIQEDMSSITTTPHYIFNLPHGRYISSFLLFLSYCAQSSWTLRLRLREENVVLWCLDTCQSVYARVTNTDFPVSLSVWASCTLRLALVIMDDNEANPNISIDPLPSLLRGEETSLSSGHKQMLVPHLSWIMAYSLQERDGIFSDGHSIVSLPISVAFQKMREFITSLQRIRFCVVMGTPDRDFPAEVHLLLPKAYYIPQFPPRLDDSSTKLFDSMTLTMRHQLRSLMQVILSAEASSSQSLVVGWGGVYSVVLSITAQARDVARDEVAEDILVMLGDLSQHVPDLLHGSSFEHGWGLNHLIWVYDQDHTTWAHNDNHVLIVRALARILLTSSGVHRLPQLDPVPQDQYGKGCDQRVALAIACAAWSPPLDLTRRTGRRRVKISRAAVENTLVILANTPNDILKERVCCIRTLLEHPQRGEEEFDYHPADNAARHQVHQVYLQFRRRLEALGDLGNIPVPAPSTLTSKPTQVGDAAVVPIPPTMGEAFQARVGRGDDQKSYIGCGRIITVDDSEAS